LIHVLVRGGYDPQINRQSRGATNAGHLAVLQHTEQFNLHIKPHVANFVEEQSAAVRFFKPANPPRMSTGKAPSFMTKEFGLDQLGRDCPAIECDKGLGMPGALVMDGAGNEFFA
jgi:hypothetical protein